MGIGGDMGVRHVNSAAARKSPVGQPLGILPHLGASFGTLALLWQSQRQKMPRG